MADREGGGLGQHSGHLDRRGGVDVVGKAHVGTMPRRMRAGDGGARGVRFQPPTGLQRR
jgi:hypothetical protein